MHTNTVSAPVTSTTSQPEVQLKVTPSDGNNVEKDIYNNGSHGLDYTGKLQTNISCCICLFHRVNSQCQIEI